MPYEQKQLWIGMVEVRASNEKSEILGDTKGAFVNIVTWASDSEHFKQNAELIIRKLGGMFVAEVIDPEPVSTRRARLHGKLDEAVEALVSRAEVNPKAIIYGTFHTFENDNA